jgi:hypothetical protein
VGEIAGSNPVVPTIASSPKDMEALARNLKGEGSVLLPHYPPKDLYLCSTAEIESLVAVVAPSSQHFGLLLALDAMSIESERIGSVAEKILRKGLVYLSAWGPDCERVHDIFDEVEIGRDPEQGKPVVMTTWHADESLEEAVWFFVNAAFSDEAYASSCSDWILASVGNRDWEKAIRESWSAKAT